MFELSAQKQDLLTKQGHLLVLGGPGSGKTTIALLKARQNVLENKLKNGQSILFLSFARATIARVEQSIFDLGIEKNIKKRINISTYHGFIWNILKSHSYLLTSNIPIKLLPPPEAASLLAEFESEKREGEKRRLFYEEGLLHFDLFAELCSELLSRSNKLAKILADTYPTIIVDEFQDTNISEWNLIQIFGQWSEIIALADAEQRIYEFRGADPARIGDYINRFEPEKYDFGNENNRSSGTDILKFGNDLLSDSISINEYNDVKIIKYPLRRGADSFLHIKTLVLKRMQELKKTSSDWSLAILLPNNQQMLRASKCLATKQTFKTGKSLPVLNHEVSLETAGPSLSAIVIAGLMEQGEAELELNYRFINSLCDHIKGRKGDAPAVKADLGLSKAMQKYIDTGKIIGKNRIKTIKECLRISKECSEILFSGDPGKDWISIRDLLAKSKCNYLKQIADDAEYLRLLHKGSLLSSGLSDLWRNKGSYNGAVNLIQNALVQEHFNNSVKEFKGIHVMTMHKAKGKEFDEVIVFEELYSGRIVKGNLNAKKRDIDQAKLKLRVAVTRAKKKATILSPSREPCILL